MASAPVVPATEIASDAVAPITWMRSLAAPLTTRTWAPKLFEMAADPSRPMFEPAGTTTSSIASVVRSVGA